MKRFQRLISTSLIFVLALFLALPQSVTVSAAAENGNTTVTVDVRVETYKKTLVPLTEVKVSSFDLQDYTTGSQPILKDSPRAIHAIIRALEEVGIDTKDPKEFDLGYGGNYISGINGLSEFDKGPLSGWMFYVDDEYVPVGVLDREINDGESIVVFYAQTFDNTYSWFEQTDITVKPGEPFTIKQSGVYFDASTSVKGATILVDNAPYKVNDKEVQTDSEGEATLTFYEPGTYILSAERENDAGEIDITRPYAKVTVQESEPDQPPVDDIRPDILIDGIKDGTTVHTDELEFSVQAVGNADEKVNPTVKLNGTTIEPESGDKYKATLNNGKNEIHVTATDQANNTNTVTYTIIYEPEESTYADLDQFIDQVAQYMLEKGIASEWEAIGLTKAGINVRASYEDVLLKHIESQIITGLENGRIKITDVERLAMAAVAIQKDPRDIYGLDLIEMIYNSPERNGGYDTMTFQGNNGPIFALIALDSNSFDVPGDAKWTRQNLIDELLRTQNENGSWNLNEAFGKPDIDITAMALAGLSPYKDQPKVKDALDNAVDWLSLIQEDNGGFDGGGFVGGITSEAASQVIIGLTAYDIDPTGERFTKDQNLIDHLLSYQSDDGGFMHTQGDGMSNDMATEQALQALVSYQLFKEGNGPLYQFDVEFEKEEQSVEIGELAYVKKGETIYIDDSNTKVVMPHDLPAGTTINVSEAENNEHEGMQSAGEVLEFDLQYPDGEKGTGKYTLTMGVNDDADVDKTGIYYFNEATTRWEYVGGWGSAKNGQITVLVNHFSTYGVFTDTDGPTDIQLTENKTTSDSITLGLSAYDPSGIEAYIIYRDGEEIAEVDGDETKFTDTNLGAGQTYKYMVTAVDRLGNQSEEEGISVSTKDANDEINGSNGDKDKHKDGNENKVQNKNTNENNEPEGTESIDTTNNDDNGSLSGKDANDNDKSSKLPETATNTFNLLLIGFVLLIVGSILLFIRKKRIIKM